MRFSLVFVVGLVLATAAEDGKHVAVPDGIEPFFATYCYGCHDSDTKKGDLNLEDLTRTIGNVTDAAHWQDVLDQMNAGEMPPKKKKQPSKEELATTIGDLTEALTVAQDRLKDSGGRILPRRLNRREYAATIRDIMGIHLNASALPDDANGRFDTIGQNQSLNALQLETYFEYNQQVARTALHWASKARGEPKVTRQELANTEGRSKRIFEIMEKVRLVKQEGKKPEEAGLTDKEWPKYDPDGPNAQNAVWKGQREYYERNLAIHDKGRMLSHDLLVEHVTLPVWADARAHYRLRFCGGVVDGVKLRRGVRVMKRNGKLSGKHGTIIGSFLISGSLDEPSVHEMTYKPVFGADFRPADRNASRDWVFFLEDKRGGPSSEQFYHHYKPIEPGVPKDTIFAKWVEIEGPFYGPKSAFEELVERHKVSSASDEELDKAANAFLAEFADIAFRQRSVPPEFITRIHGYYQLRRANGASFKAAIVDPLALILSSPRFLYLLEPADEEQTARELDAASLANRLSYFLWSGPPDTELRNLATTGSLQEPEVLNQQVDRMLNSPRAAQFHRGFMGQWMHLKRFDAVGVDSKLQVHRTDGMIHASREEPIRFFETMVQENLSAAVLIDSDFVLVNGVLATKYGLADLYSGDGFKKVQLPPDSPRGGLITQAAFLSTGTMGSRSSPVIRGALVKDILLNEPPPPPPPNVPELVAAGTDPLASVRSLVELHQKKPQCASCHARFDFIGLGLENFDAVGLWRDEEVVTNATEAQQIPRRPKKIYPVDAGGELPNGDTFADVQGLKSALLKQKRKVAESLFEGLLCYGLGRDLTFTDRPLVEATLDELEAADYPVRDLIKRVVASKQFQNR